MVNPAGPGMGVGQHAADEDGHLPPSHLFLGREVEGRRPLGHPHLVDLADGGAGPEVNRGHVREVVVVGFDVIDVRTSWAGGGGARGTEPAIAPCGYG